MLPGLYLSGFTFHDNHTAVLLQAVAAEHALRLLHEMCHKYDMQCKDAQSRVAWSTVEQNRLEWSGEVKQSRQS